MDILLEHFLRTILFQKNFVLQQKEKIYILLHGFKILRFDEEEKNGIRIFYIFAQKQ